MESEDSEAVDEGPEERPRSRRQDEDPLSMGNLLRSVYNNKYYWDIVKSVVIFAVALKVAHECKHIAIPMKDYEPFDYINVCTCR